MLKRLAGACIDRRLHLLDGAALEPPSSSSSAVVKVVADGGDSVVGGASTVADTERQAQMKHHSGSSSPTKVGKVRFDIKALMRGHLAGTKKARYCLMAVPVVMILVMITRPLYAPLIDVFGDDGFDAHARGEDSDSDVNPVSMNMQLLQKHWPLVHGKKHGKVPGKKGQAKHTYGSDTLAGGGGGGSSQRLRRAMLAATDAEGVEGGGMGRGGGRGRDGVGTEWSAPGADSTAAPPLSP